VVPEAVDVWLLDPNIISPLKLAERKSWAFLSVFKMEDRKGWRELVLAYHQEFTADDDVTLVIHTYMYDVPGDAWDANRIRQVYDDYLEEVLGDQLAPKVQRPHIHIIGHYLTGHQIPQLYRACDAYVGPSYGEGWGLPYQEAMSMGLPVIATRWSGQTEFLNDDVAYMVDVEGLVPSPSSDAWFGGFKWAKPSVTSLRRQMRVVFNDQDRARARGYQGRLHVMNKYAVEPVSQLILSQLRRIERSNWQAAIEATSVGMANKSISDDSLNWVTHSETIELCRTMPLAKKGSNNHATSSQILSCATKRQQQKDSGVAMKGKPCMRIGMISTIPPTKCGIAMFSSHMLNAFQQVAGHLAQFSAIPIVDDLYALPEHVPNVEIENTTVEGVDIGVHIRRQNSVDYVKAAERINNDYDAVIIQHEFGIFGGHAGAYILCLARLLNIPVLINFHTVHEHLDRNTHAVLMALEQVATHTVTMTRMGARFMRMFHAIPPHKLAVIAHGVPKLPSDMDRVAAKKKWGLDGQFVMLSSGFIGPNKGYHNTIHVLAALLKQYDNVTLIIAGEPHIKCGRICRDYLTDLLKSVDQLQLGTNIRLMTSFIPSSTLHSLMAAADIYIAAYTESEVSSSGTVSLAMTASRVVVATPFIYTKEALSHGRGILLPSFNDVIPSMTRAISSLIEEPWRKTAMEKAAAIWQSNNEWNSVARQWLPLLGLVSSNTTITTLPTTASSFT
jgi:glycosyltransferase involved in cell wall biosynthesis